MAESGTTPLTAYLQLVPKIKADGMSQDVTPALEKEGERAGRGFGRKFLAAFAALGVGAAVVSTMKQAFSAYSEFEQLAGGAELLWGGAYDTVAENAANAYATVQMSQNEYLRQANAFAVAFKDGLNGDEQAAAELADRMIQTQADIVAATGISSEAASNAINGILRGNYAMLDNLQLGIKPTQEGFAEMMATVNAWHEENGDATRYVMGNYADMEAALADYVQMQGLAGYAANEAANTIQGSTASMRASWQNLLVGIAQGDADIIALTHQFVDSLSATIGNALPVILNIVRGIFEALPTAIEELIPQLMDFLIQTVETLPELLEAGMIAITKLIEGIAANMPALMKTAVDVIVKIALTLSKPENLVPLLNAALVLINELARGLVLAIPDLIAAIPELVDSLVSSFISFMPQFVQMGVQIIAGLVSGVINAGARLGEALLQVAKNAWNKAKNWLGIASPSKRFAEMGGFVAAGLAQGLEGGADMVNRSMDNLIGDMTHRAEIGLNAFGTAQSVTINASVNASSLADVDTVGQLVTRLMDARQSQQVRIERMGAAYGY